MNNPKIEMPKLDEVCEIILENGECHLAMLVKTSYKAKRPVWYNDLYDRVFKNSEVKIWKYFFPN